MSTTTSPVLGAFSATPQPEPVALVDIRPSKGWLNVNVQELWDYRELLYFLMWRDIKVKYKQTLLGASWAVIQPLLTMAIFAIFFGRLAGMPSDGVPYPLWSFAALVPWTFFANALSQSSNSVVQSGQLIKKVYFPRLAVPLASALAGLLDFAIAFSVLLVIMAIYGVAPGANIVWLPVLVLLAVTASLGVGFWFSALNVQFRDIRYVIPFLVQIWLFATPIAYASSQIPTSYEVFGLIVNPKLIYSINPMVGVVEGFRWALLDMETSPLDMVAVSAVVAVIFFVSGLYFFRRMERTFADVV